MSACRPKFALPAGLLLVRSRYSHFKHQCTVFPILGATFVKWSHTFSLSDFLFNNIILVELVRVSGVHLRTRTPDCSIYRSPSAVHEQVCSCPISICLDPDAIEISSVLNVSFVF